MGKLRVLIGCERNGKIRDAFLRRGHDAWSCDLVPTTRPGPHWIGDVREALARGPWDIFICHPDCTFLSGSGIHWNNRGRGWQKTDEAAAFFKEMYYADILWDVDSVVIENPVGIMSTRLHPPTQYIQPYEFGHDASKKTGLWLKNLPRLTLDPAKRIPGRLVVQANGKVAERWGNQTDSGQNKLAPSKARAMLRAETYDGWAEAFADQWGRLTFPRRAA